jgi:O-methyltransferase involved in polyketide biosynthesis
MSMKTSLDIDDVQKTLLIPLLGRALESSKKKPLLIDKLAKNIVEGIDFDFSSISENMTELNQITYILRSITFDDVIKDYVKRFPKATMVNLGCGLDTTFERIDNGSILWYNIDFPEVIHLRNKLIKEKERCKNISSSFLDDGWQKEIRINENILFTAIGVFYYLEEKEVKEFIRKLICKYPGSEIIFDVSSSTGIKNANETIIKKSGLEKGSYLKWGPKNIQEILSWDKRIQLIKNYNYYIGRHTNLSARNRIIGYLSDLLKIQYIVHLRLNKK